MNCLASITDPAAEGAYVARGLRDAAAVCRSDQAALATRLQLAAYVIDELLARRAALANKETIASTQRQQVDWSDHMRFWPKVNILGSDECWAWKAGCSRRGYGTFWIHGTQINASRAAWILVNGEIADGLHVCHRCDNPPCCNPLHLWLGTDKDNVRDAATKKRLAGQKQTHCKYGHEFTADNIYWQKGAFVGQRACKTCRRIRIQKFNSKKRIDQALKDEK